VRNDGTKPWLESMLGNETDRIVAIPDPRMYVPTADVHHPELEEGVTNVLVSLNNEDERARFGLNLAWWGRAQRLARRVGGRVRRIAGFPSKTRDRKRVFLESLAAVLERVFKNRRVNFILCPHYFYDYQIMAELLSLCSWRIGHEATVSCGVPRVAGAPGFYDLYAKVDAVLSMRVHSMSPAVGLGTPLVALVSDPRMSHFMGDVGLSEFAVDIFDPDLTDKVYGLLTRILDRREDVQRRLTEVRTSMRERTRAYHTRIARLLQS
jgi:polysaccharide pyruvyl transferase WcaK-like protein